MIKKTRPNEIGSTQGQSEKQDIPTPEMLNLLLQQKPENVGNALQSWVNEDQKDYE